MKMMKKSMRRTTLMKKNDDLPKIRRTLEKYKNYNIKVNIEAADGTAKAQFIKSIELSTILLTSLQTLSPKFMISCLFVSAVLSPVSGSLMEFI